MFRAASCPSGVQTDKFSEMRSAVATYDDEGIRRQGRRRRGQRADRRVVESMSRAPTACSGPWGRSKARGRIPTLRKARCCRRGVATGPRAQNMMRMGDSRRQRWTQLENLVRAALWQERLGPWDVGSHCSGGTGGGGAYLCKTLRMQDPFEDVDDDGGGAYLRGVHVGPLPGSKLTSCSSCVQPWRRGIPPPRRP